MAADSARTLVVPVRFHFTRPITFKSAVVVPGVTLRRYTGRWATESTRWPAASSQVPKIAPTHMIMIKPQEYLAHLDVRLRAEGKRLDSPIHVDADGIVRQVLISLTLLAGLAWTISGIHEFERRKKIRMGHSYLGRPKVDMSFAIRQALFPRLNRRITARGIRMTAGVLDRYYRSGTCRTDRLGVALGYLWSSLTTTHAELAFSGLMMVLEALVFTGRYPIDRHLAERCAFLTTRNRKDRLPRYKIVKHLYRIRSDIVHGDAGPQLGPLTSASLYVMAKDTNIPTSELSDLVMLALDTVEGIIRSPELLAIFHKNQKDKLTKKEIDTFFIDRLR